jgi:hypothetical protein
MNRTALFALALLVCACLLAFLGCATTSSDTTTTTTASSVTTTTGGGSKSWSIVGTAGFTGTTEVNDGLIAADSSGNLYVAFNDTDFSAAPLPMVMKYSGGSWNYVGAKGFGLTSGSTLDAGNLSFTIDGDTPYVAFRDKSGINEIISAAYFDGVAWVSLSTVYSSWSDSLLCPSIYVDSSGVYCALKESGIGTNVGQARSHGTSGWGALGSQFFSDGALNTPCLVDAGGVVYIAFIDIVNSGLTVVQKSGGNWVSLGAKGGVATTTSLWPSLAVDSITGDPYVAYLVNDGTNNRVCVKKYSGGSWSLVGSAAVSDGAAGYPSLCIYHGTPYVAYADEDGKATVKKYSGGSWQTVGTRSFSADVMPNGTDRTISLTISGGIPSVVVRGGAHPYRLTVYTYN